MEKNETLDSMMKKAKEEIDIISKKETLKKLHYSMMKIEIDKMEIENNYAADIDYYGLDKAKATYSYNICNAYKEGYEIGFEFFKLKNHLYMQNQLTLDETVKYSDASFISAKYLLRKYGLNYPECWEVGFNGIKYFNEEVVDNNHLLFVQKVDDMFNNNKISQIEKGILMLTGEYLYNRSKYYLSNKNEEQKDTILTKKNNNSSK